MDQQVEVRIRSAQPIIGEGRACGRYLDEVAHGFFGMMLGKEAEDIISRAYVEPNHTYSYENVLFAELEGAIVGMVLAFEGSQHRSFSDEPLRAAAGKQLRRMRVVQALCAPMMRILNSVPCDDHYVLSFAVDGDVRGKGVGSRLLDEVERRAVEQGAKRLSLDVGVSNDGARRLYERRGLTIESRWPRRIPLPGISMLRMAKPL